LLELKRKEKRILPPSISSHQKSGIKREISDDKTISTNINDKNHSGLNQHITMINGKKRIRPTAISW
jgi:hypothetical protein